MVPRWFHPPHGLSIRIIHEVRHIRRKTWDRITRFRDGGLLNPHQVDHPELPAKSGTQAYRAGNSWHCRDGDDGPAAGAHGSVNVILIIETQMARRYAVGREVLLL
jgi:hypothetical protein